MVSGGTVSGDLNSLKTNLTNYNSEITSLSSNWKGSSYDNLVSKAEEFVSEYQSTISGEMSSFASACDLYAQYVTAKSNLAAAQSAYNQAVAEDDKYGMSVYSAQISEYTSQINSLKAQIESCLASASAISLAASGSSGLSSISIHSGTPLGVDAGTYSNTFTSSAGNSMKYHAYVPNNATEGMPLIVYLHGDGSVGKFDHLEHSEMASCVSKIYGEDFPFIYIQPMTEVTSWTSDGRLDTLSELIQNVATEYKCDPNKIILTGASRGGMGAWAMADAYPDMFSAFVPVSGTGNIDATHFVNLPTLAVSTPDESDSWNYSNMKSNVKKINEAGGNATFVSQDGYSHHSVIKGTYTEETFDWMISQV